MKALSIAALLCLLTLGGCAQNKPAAPVPPQPVASLDVPRYMGLWYEIARFPNDFQEDCVGFTTAQYSLNPDGTVNVTNRCRVEGGQTEVTSGLARQVGGEDSPRFKVRFAPSWLSFLPMVWGDYWVIELDDGYKLAAVSEPERENLWILSRTPEVPAAEYQALLAQLRKQGFDLSRLRPTRQLEN